MMIKIFKSLKKLNQDINMITTFENYLNEKIKSQDKDILKLVEIAKRFENPDSFRKYLNRNEWNHGSDEDCFLGERFNRLNRGYRLSGSDKITIYRTGDKPILWGDYVYLGYNDAYHAWSVGQGKKIYQKNVIESDVVETTVSGEYYYSPKNIAAIGEDLEDFWYYANDIKKLQQPENLDTTNIKNLPLNIRIKKFKEELKKVGKQFDNFHDYEDYVLKLGQYDNYNVPVVDIDYEKYYKL